MDDLSGLLPVFKPTGMTSKDVSRVLQRRYGKLKIGHVGTLDPDADGVLPVLIGNATKLQDYLLAMPKAYRFVLKLGTATDSLDASGTEIAKAPWEHVTRGQIETALSKFKGQITQIPPLFSAVKLSGKELYKHARRKEQITPDQLASLARQVIVYDIELIRCELPEIELFARCSKGTYVRTIGTDLAASLGTVGHITLLRREESSGIKLEECVSLDHCTDPSANLGNYIRPTNELVIGLPVFVTDDTVMLRRLLSGQHLELTRQEFILRLNPKNFEEAEARGVLLKDSGGKSVGLVEVVNAQEQFVVIHLKRGL